MGSGAGLRSALVFVALSGVLAVDVASHATTVPLPKGVVVGRQFISVRCDYSHCVYTRVFSVAKVAGRLNGVLLVGSATYMQYEWHQTFCPYGPCPPTKPILVAPFTIKGITAGGAAFSAACTSGKFMQTIPELSELTIGIVDLPIVSASCEGGTPSAQGPFAFRFLIPEDIVTEFAAADPRDGPANYPVTRKYLPFIGSVFAAMLVEV